MYSVVMGAHTINGVPLTCDRSLLLPMLCNAFEAIATLPVLDVLNHYLTSDFRHVEKAQCMARTHLPETFHSQNALLDRPIILICLQSTS